MEQSAAKGGIISHPLPLCDSMTPDTTPGTTAPGTPESGSPDDSNYSPSSQPYAERPPNRTLAGQAVRQSISNLPSPPPFTPGGLEASVQQQSPGLSMFSGASCGSSKPSAADAETPGITSAWAGSSTKAPSESFAFVPHPAEASSPDVQPFAQTTTTPEATPNDLVARAVHNASLSRDTDAASEASHSSATSRSSSTWRDRQSPGDLIRKVKGIVEREAAIGGSSRLQRGKKHRDPLKTPTSQGITPSNTPHNTPMDVESEHCGDQEVLQPATALLPSPLAASPVAVVSVALGAASGPATPASVATAAASPAQSPVAQVTSPAESRTSVVSIGSHCGPPAAVSPADEATPAANKRLDFSGPEFMSSPAVGTSATPVMSVMSAVEATPHASPEIDLQGSPMPLDKLAAMMQDSATKKSLAAPLTADKDALAARRRLVDEEDFAAGADPFGPVPPADSPQQGRSWLRKSGTALLWLLAGVGLVACAFLVVELLPPTVAPPGVWCTPDNIPACTRAYEASLKQAARELPAWRIPVLQAKWYLADMWDLIVRRKLPQGVTADDFQRAWISKITEHQQRTMPVDVAADMFRDVPKHLVPPIIASKLEAAHLIEQQRQWQQQKPEDLVAVSNAPPVAAEESATDAAAAAEPAEVPPEAGDSTGEGSQEGTAAAEPSSLTAAEEPAAPAVLEEAAAEDQQPVSEEVVTAEPIAAAVDKQAAEVEQQTEDEHTAAGVAVEKEAAAAVAADDGQLSAAPAEQPAVQEEQEAVQAVEPVPVDQAASLGDEAAVTEAAAQAQQQAHEDQQSAQEAEQPSEEVASLPAGDEAALTEQLVREQPAVEPEVPSSETAAEAPEQQAGPAEQEQPAAEAGAGEAAGVLPSSAEQPAASAAEGVEMEMVQQAGGAAVWQMLQLHWVIATVVCLVLFIAVAVNYLPALLSNRIMGGEPAGAHEEAEQLYAAAAAGAAYDADAAGPILTDEEMEEEEEEEQRPRRTPGRSPLSAAAMQAGEQALLAVTRVLSPAMKAPPPSAVAERTPRATRSGGGRTISGGAGARRRTRSAVADGGESDGEEVHMPVPPSSGRTRRGAATPRVGRLNPLPEDQPAALGLDLDNGDPHAALLSDEEQAAPKSTRRATTRRRSSTTDDAAAGTSGAAAAGAGRRRSAPSAAGTSGAAADAAAAAATTTPSVRTRRASRN